MDHLGHALTPILVTGASGYLGAHILALLRDSGVSAFGVGRSKRCDTVCDLTDGAATVALLSQYSDSPIINCAAVVPKSPSGYFDESTAAANLAMVRNLANAKPRRVIFASSMTVYPEGTLLAREEDAVAIGKGYASSKLEAERILLACPDITTTILRLPGLFGLPRRGGVLANSALALARGDVPTLDPSLPQWAAMHVEDAAEICVRATLVSEPYSMVMNAGYPEPMAIADAVMQLATLFGREVSVPPPKWFAFDLARLHSFLGPVAGKFDDRLRQMAMWAYAEVGRDDNA
jgi:nucleoside-diphosphate-sugar epimerase